MQLAQRVNALGTSRVVKDGRGAERERFAVGTNPSNPTPAKTGRLTIPFVRLIVDNFVYRGRLSGCERVS